MSSFSAMDPGKHIAGCTRCGKNIFKFKIRAVFAVNRISPPRVDDRWLMPLFAEMGYSNAEQEHLNCVCLHM